MIEALGQPEQRTTTTVYDGESNVVQSIDALGRVTSYARNAVTKTYSYDATNQLTSDNGTSHSYDPNGNRTDIGYVTGPNNLLLSDGVFNYFYDNENNLTSKVSIATGETWSYATDNRNQMISATHQATSVGPVDLSLAFVYDVYQNRIEKDVDPDGVGSLPATVSRFAYDGMNAYADLNAGSSLTTRRIFGLGINVPLARITSTDVGWYLTDHQGSVREIANNTTGTFVYEVAYDAFGNIQLEVNPAFSDRYGYGQMIRDPETGLLLAFKRYYIPSIGRFTSEDPIYGEPNAVWYVHNNVTNQIDPQGLFGRRQRGASCPPQEPLPAAPKELAPEPELLPVPAEEREPELLPLPTPEVPPPPPLVYIQPPPVDLETLLAPKLLPGPRTTSLPPILTGKDVESRLRYLRWVETWNLPLRGAPHPVTPVQPVVSAADRERAMIEGFRRILEAARGAEMAVPHLLNIEEKEKGSQLDLMAKITDGKLKITVKRGKALRTFNLQTVIQGQINNDTDSVQVAVRWTAKNKDVGHDTNAKPPGKRERGATWEYPGQPNKATTASWTPKDIKPNTNVPDNADHLDVILIYTDVINESKGDLPIVIGSFSADKDVYGNWRMKPNPGDVFKATDEEVAKLNDNDAKEIAKFFKITVDKLLEKTGYELQSRPAGFDPSNRPSFGQLRSASRPKEGSINSTTDTGHDIKIRE